jgi:hypothetical protein
MKAKPFPQSSTRSALVSALPPGDQSDSEPRDPRFTFVPPSHARALNPDSTIVEGMRGAGKSHWWAALNSERHRRYLAEVFPEARIKDNLQSSQGFGTRIEPDLAPGKDVLAKLIKVHNARHIWQAVIAVHARFPMPFPQEPRHWEHKVEWIKENPEEFDVLLYQADALLTKQGRMRLILFDALDRMADDWAGIRPLARGLFQLALDLVALRSLRIKLFVRPDMLQDKEIQAFPDSSKLFSRKVELAWQRADLYALLFQCLGNAPVGSEDFREHCKQYFDVDWTVTEPAGWVLPNSLRADELLQKSLFHEIAGPTMSSGPQGHKRGYPYTWLPNHLVDSRDKVSPRSFVAALRSAGESPIQPNWQYAVHYKALQDGVLKASQIRVKEITQEDYPWVDPLMEPLKNRIVVPCEVDDIFQIWATKKTIENLSSSISGVDVRLLAPHSKEGAQGVLRDLEDLGVVSRLLDDRVQMPDIYRIAFGLGRKGGVKPLK